MKEKTKIQKDRYSHLKYLILLYWVELLVLKMSKDKKLNGLDYNAKWNLEGEESNINKTL